MEIEVFNRTIGETYASAALISDFDSLIVTERYYKANDFTLTVFITFKNVTYLIPDNCLLIDGCFYYIDKVTTESVNEGMMKVSGYSLAALLKVRVILENYARTANPRVIAEDLITRHAINPTNIARKTTLLTLSASTVSLSNIQYQNSYGVVLDEIETLCETYDFGYRETPSSLTVPSCQIQFYKGQDKSNVVSFSRSNDTLLDESYDNNNYDEANTAIVAGEGEGSARQIVLINDANTGIERKELYVDAKDLQSTNDGVTMTAEEYTQALINRGNSKLSEKQRILLLDGDIDAESTLFKLGEDYQNGDTVNVYSEKFGLSYNATLTEIEKTWDKDGYHIAPTFGKRTPTILDIIRRK